MAITLSDVGEGEELTPGQQRVRVGCIIFKDDESWTASCPPMNDFSATGQGILDGLPTDVLWLVNQNYEKTGAIAQLNPDLRIRLNSWMRLAMDDFPGEWSSFNLPDAQLASLMSRSYDRVMKLTIEACRRARISNHRTETGFEEALLRAPSLATGIRKLIEPRLRDLKLTGKQAQFRRLINETHQAGVHMSGADSLNEGEMLITLRLPRFSHAMNVTSVSVPGQTAEWLKANVTESEQNFAQTLAEMRALDRPVLVTANIKERQGQRHPYLDGWIKASSRATRRLSYTLEEIEILNQFYVVSDWNFFVSKAKARPATAQIMDNLLYLCGNRTIASSMWSAGLAAENIICGTMRRMTQADGAPSESLWLAARDRILMWEPVREVLNAGATLVRAHAGSIVVKCPADPEIVTMVIQAALSVGLMFPMGQVREFATLGITVPSEEADWKGPAEDNFYVTFAHLQGRNMAWRLDQLAELDPQERIEKFQTITNQS